MLRSDLFLDKVIISIRDLFVKYGTVLSVESLLLPIEKQYQTQPIVKKGVNKKFSRLYLGI